MMLYDERKVESVFVGGPLDGIRKCVINASDRHYIYSPTGPRHLYTRVGLPLMVSEYAPVDRVSKYVQVYRYDGIKE